MCTLKNNAILLIVVLLEMAISAPLGAADAFSKSTSGIELKVTLNKQYCEAGEPITATCELRNVSNSALWLAPLQIVDVHFRLYRDDFEVLPFEKAHTCGIIMRGYIELQPGEFHIFKLTLDKDGYKMPSDAGEYRLCINYQNDKKSTRDYELRGGKVDCCVFLKIR
jgi:hypothetical protein